MVVLQIREDLNMHCCSAHKGGLEQCCSIRKLGLEHSCSTYKGGLEQCCSTHTRKPRT